MEIGIKNFLSIADVEIKAGKINQVFGKNNQGKTSIIKAIEFAFKGSTDPDLIRSGEESAEVVLELKDNMVISRKLNSAGKQTLSVTKAGMKAQGPQSYLSQLFEGISFNPLEILDPKSRNQFIIKALDLKITKEELSELSGISLEELPELKWEAEDALSLIEQAYNYYYLKRGEANKKAKMSKSRFDTYAEDVARMNLLPEPEKSREALNEEILKVKHEIIS